MKIGIETKELSQILEQLHFQEDQINDLRDQIENADRDLNRKNTRIVELNNRMRDMEVESTQYQQSIQGLQEKIKELESDKRILADTILDNLRLRKAAEEDNKALGENLKAAIEDICRNQTEMDRQENEMQILKQANADLRQALELERNR